MREWVSEPESGGQPRKPRCLIHHEGQVPYEEVLCDAIGIGGEKAVIWWRSVEVRFGNRGFWLGNPLGGRPLQLLKDLPASSILPEQGSSGWMSLVFTSAQGLPGE